jgi:hypothetical protein
MGVVVHSRAGVHYPRSVGEFQAWFRMDAGCLDYYADLRIMPMSAPKSLCGNGFVLAWSA